MPRRAPSPRPAWTVLGRILSSWGKIKYYRWYRREFWNGTTQTVRWSLINSYSSRKTAKSTQNSLAKNLHEKLATLAKRRKKEQTREFITSTNWAKKRGKSGQAWWRGKAFFHHDIAYSCMKAMWLTWVKFTLSHTGFGRCNSQSPVAVPGARTDRFNE